MVGFHIFNPLLFLYTHVAPKIITPLYNRFGIPGLLGLPWIMLGGEKACYDTFCAARGHDMYAERKRTGVNPHGEFPSGGAALPSFSFIETRGEADRWIFTWLGDEPRRTSEAAAQPAAS